MKNFTFLLIILLVATVAHGQQSLKLQQKITKMQESFSQFTWQTKHLSKAGFQFAPVKSGNSLLKSALAIQKLDSVIYQEYDSQNEEWINQWKDVYQYDSELRNSAWIEMGWNNTLDLWENSNKIELELTDDGQVRIMKSYVTSDTSGDFIQDSWSEAYYNEEGRLDSIIHYYFVTEGDWGEEGRQVYHYNEAGQLVEMDFQALVEDEEEEYLQEMRFVYSYNDAGQMTTSAIYLLYEEMEILFFETEFIYDSTGRLVATEDSSLDVFTSAVELNSRTDYEYNASGDVSVETFSTRDSEAEEWIVEEKDEYTYSNIDFSEVIFPSYGQFWGLNEETITFNYTITEIVTSDYQEGNWNETFRRLFYYSEGTATSTSDIADARISVFPNPASDNITLRWDGNEFLSLELYNITGVKVIEKQVSSGMDIRVSSLTNGIYILKLLKDNQTIYSGKVVKK